MSAMYDFGRAAEAPRSVPESAVKRPASRKSDHRVSLRLTPEEHAKLVELAEGMTLSAYIWACVFADGAAPRKRQLRKVHLDDQAVAEILGLLGQSRVANNLNQLARAANSGSLLCDDETTAMISEAYEHVGEMRSLLIVALGLKDSASSNSQSQ